MSSSIDRPLMPPLLLMRSTAICTPTSAVLPPDAAVPDRGWRVPILKGLACPKAARHGAGTSIVAPSAPAAPADSPRKRRRVVLPLHHMSRAQASSCHRSAIVASSSSRVRSGSRSLTRSGWPSYTPRRGHRASLAAGRGTSGLTSLRSRPRPPSPAPRARRPGARCRGWPAGCPARASPPRPRPRSPGTPG